ncbi:hypothetical protein H9P43_005166 [Blastocladiella emersonii ATCC 22665]|nr:hypothetical protein H9P43_005166 [Blastocladiella emersonii ATCC 22665]
MKGLDLPQIIESVLCYAVELHDDENDLVGLMQYARVMRRADIPRVTGAILQRCPFLSIDEASTCGDLELLELWCESASTLRYSAEALLGAAHNNHYGVLDWWRDSGLPLPPYDGELHETEFRVVAGVVGARAIAEMVELRTLPDTYVEPGDEYIKRNLAAITAGQFDYLSIKGGRLTASGIEALSGALSHNCQALRVLHFDPCNLSIDAVRSITLPPSANVTTFEFEALRHDLPYGAY